MKRLVTICVVVLAVAALAPMLAGDKGERCTADAQTCLNQFAQKVKDRGWLGVELAYDEGGRPVVQGVEPDSPAMRSGLQQGDVLVAMNGIDYSEANRQRLHEAWSVLRPGNRVAYTIERGGCCHRAAEASEIALTLAPVPEAVLAKWIGGHMMGHHLELELARN